MLRTCVRLLAVCALSLSVVSCGDQQPTPKTGGPKIVYIAKNADNPYFDNVAAGLDKAATEYGSTFVKVAPPTADAASQIPLVEQAVSDGAKVIVITPNSPDAVVPALKDAMSKGVTVVTIDSDLTGHEDARHAAVLAANPTLVGETQIEMMGGQLYYRGKFAILSATADAPNQNAWIAAMKKTLAENPKYKQMELVDVVYGNDNLQTSREVCEKLIAGHPDLRGILSPTTVGIQAAAETLDMLGKYSQIKLTGLGSPGAMRPFVRNGVLRTFGLWYPDDEGYAAGVVGIQTAQGTLKPTPGTKVTIGKYEDRVFDDKYTISADAMLTFDRENVDQFAF